MKDVQSGFRFFVNTDVRFGNGYIRKLPSIIKKYKFNDISIVIDHKVATNPVILSVIKDLSDDLHSVATYKNTAQEPDYDYLDAFKSKLSSTPTDCLIAVGGGSTIDLAKGVAILLTNDGPALSYRGFPDLKNKPIPLIAIPTTAGTGSEVTYNAVFTYNKEKKKLGINSIMNFPLCAIIDPELTLTCPPSVTVSSGVDSLVHTLESFIHKDHTPISRMYSKEAFRLLYNALNTILENPQSIKLRYDLALGAYLGATALFNAGSGIAGALSYPLGAHYKVPHGYAGAVFLFSVTKFNIEAGYDDYSELYNLIEDAEVTLSLEEKNRSFLIKIKKLVEKLEIEKSLRPFGLKEKDISFLIDQYDMLQKAFEQNPVFVTKQDIARIVRESISIL